MSTNALLFSDTFSITDVNPHKKRFERVNRIVGRGTLYDVNLVLDINCEIYNVKKGEDVGFILTSSPYLDGRGDPKDFISDMGQTLLDQYEYVMYGKVFKVEMTKGDHGKEKEPTMHIMASFGGLLMKLSGDHKNLSTIVQDSNIYLLLRRVKATA